MDSKDWIAVAQVYATLAHVRVTAATAQTDPGELRGFLESALRNEQKARDCLRAAGVSDA